MKILATYNIKGGVGTAATYLLRVRPRVKGGGRALIQGSRELDAAIKGTDFDNLDLLPADFTFRNLDLLLDATKKPTRRRVRPGVPRLPAGHLAAVGERAARRRHRAGADHPHHALAAHP